MEKNNETTIVFCLHVDTNQALESNLNFHVKVVVGITPVNG